MKSDEKIEMVRDGLRKFNRRAGVLKSDPYGIGISLSQGSALADIERLGSVRSNEIVRLLNLEKSSVSRLISVLSQKGLVRIQPDPGDGRLNVLSLTRAGRSAVKVINRMSNESVKEIFAFLSNADQEKVAAAFAALAKAVESAAQVHS